MNARIPLEQRVEQLNDSIFCLQEAVDRLAESVDGLKSSLDHATANRLEEAWHPVSPD